MFRFLTAGESHGPCLTAVVEGLPAGLKIDPEKINREMARRQEGFGRGGRMKIERDRADFLSGVRFGETLGSPVTLRISNADWVNWEERMSSFGEPVGPVVTAPRPGHADLNGCQKYDRKDVRDILDVSHVVRAAANLQQRIVAGRCGVGGIEEQAVREA